MSDADGPDRPPTRIALVTDYDFPTGGIEQFVLQLARRLGERFRCTVLSWTGNVLTPDGIAVEIVEHGDPRVVWDVLAGADVAVLVTSFNVRLLARGVLDYLGTTSKPVVTVVQTSSHSQPHTGIAPVQLQWLRGLLTSSDVVVAVSEDVRAALEDLLGPGVAPPRTVVIENAARLNGSRPDRRTRTVVGFIGRPSPQKGFHLYERLAQDNAHRGLDFSANTVSLPPARLLPEVRYSHNCTDEELTEFLTSLDVLVAPYLHSDGLPLALQEALNCGVPVIGFDSPGVGALLRRHGQVVVAPTYEALEAALIAWQDGTLVIPPPAPGNVADWDAAARAYIELIDGLVARPR